MKIVAIHEDGTEIDVTEGVTTAFNVVTDSDEWYDAELPSRTGDAILALARACNLGDHDQLADDVQTMRRKEEERAAYAAKRAKEAEDRAKEAEDRATAARLLAAEMREKEPHLAQYTDEQLVRLHEMRNAGTA